MAGMAPFGIAGQESEARLAFPAWLEPAPERQGDCQLPGFSKKRLSRCLGADMDMLNVVAALSVTAVQCAPVTVTIVVDVVVVVVAVAAVAVVAALDDIYREGIRR